MFIHDMQIESEWFPKSERKKREGEKIKEFVL